MLEITAWLLNKSLYWLQITAATTESQELAQGDSKRENWRWEWTGPSLVRTQFRQKVAYDFTLMSPADIWRTERFVHRSTAAAGWVYPDLCFITFFFFLIFWGWLKPRPQLGPQSGDEWDHWFEAKSVGRHR